MISLQIGFLERVENVKRLCQLIHLISRFCYNASLNYRPELSASSKKTRTQRPAVSTWNSTIYWAKKHVPHTYCVVMYRYTKLLINFNQIGIINVSYSFKKKSKQPFAIYYLLASCNVCPVAIPEIFAQTEGSDYWQLIRHR